LKNFNKLIETNTEFLLEEIDFPRHDYFLMNFRPAEGTYYQMALLKGGKQRLVMQVAVNAEGEAISLPNIPFGGMWISGTPTPSSLFLFLVEIEKALLAKGVVSLKVIQPPVCYEKHSDILGYFLKTSGFQLTTILNHQIFAGKKKIQKQASQLKNKFAPKIKQLGLTVTRSSFVNFDFLRDIKRWNVQRGYQIKFAEEQLLLQLSEYPERFTVISVLKDQAAIGHAFAVRLTANSIYYFLAATNPDMQHKVTGEVILSTLFELAAEQKADFIDLGSSDLDGKPNLSLIFFKSKFANAFQNKNIWEKSFIG
jgi:hypothetical protein